MSDFSSLPIMKKYMLKEAISSSISENGDAWNRTPHRIPLFFLLDGLYADFFACHPIQTSPTNTQDQGPSVGARMELLVFQILTASRTFPLFSGMNRSKIPSLDFYTGDILKMPYSDFLKERLFGLSNPQGNHGESLKEAHFHLDNTPTHSYMKYLYKYPQRKFPYQALIEENAKRSRDVTEYTLLDTGIFKCVSLSLPIIQRVLGP